MTVHKPVLLHQTLELLGLKAGNVFLDGTFGGGGHGMEIVKAIAPNGRYIAIDKDKNAITNSGQEIKTFSESLQVECRLINGDFRNAKDILESLGIEKIDRALLDLGFSSDQMDESGRGFSFLRNEPLLMTLSPDDEISARDLINTASENKIEEILSSYGEEKFSKQIARAICEDRKTNAITTTWELVEVIKKATPSWYHHKKIHPATKVFQALRIWTNDELGALEKFLADFKHLAVKGTRLAVISFHSLEDRIVKRMFKGWEDEGLAVRVNKKAEMPVYGEIKSNRRSRSAKLRVCEFL